MPGPVVALVTMTLVAWWFAAAGRDHRLALRRHPAHACPSSRCRAFSWESAKQLVIPTLTIALLGAIESLLCARVADNLTELPRHDPNQELMAQGVANMVSAAVRRHARHRHHRAHA